MKSAPLYCASDFHLGYEYANYDAIKRFLRLAQAEAGSLILCGDIFDLWRNDLASIQEQEPMKSAYQELIRTSVVVPTRLIWGNHDYQLAGKIPLWVTDDFVQDEVLFTHGWRMDVEQRVASPLYSWFVTAFPVVYQRLFKRPTDTQKRGGQPCRADEIHATAQLYARLCGYKFIVMGHTHCPGIYGNVLDTGDFVDHATYIVFDKDKPELRKLECPLV